MVGQNIHEYTLKKKDQIVTMDAKGVVTINNEVVHIDPQLLFRRLVSAGTKNEQLSEIFKYELCS